MLRKGYGLSYGVYKQVVMNMSMTRDPRAVKVSTTPPHPHTPYIHNSIATFDPYTHYIHHTIATDPSVFGFLFLVLGTFGGGVQGLGITIWLDPIDPIFGCQGYAG